MNKLSTSQLKNMISEWLSKPEIRNDLKHHSDIKEPNKLIKDWSNDNKEISIFEYEKKLWQAPASVVNADELEKFIWSLWCDGSQWKREEKLMLKEEWSTYLACGESKWEGWGKDAKCTDTAGFFIDMIGDQNKDLVVKFFNNPEQAKKCILRVFVPDNQLADNYRLEVVTTPDDTEVVGWTVIVD